MSAKNTIKLREHQELRSSTYKYSLLSAPVIMLHWHCKKQLPSFELKWFEGDISLFPRLCRERNNFYYVHLFKITPMSFSPLDLGFVIFLDYKLTFLVNSNLLWCNAYTQFFVCDSGSFRWMLIHVWKSSKLVSISSLPKKE